MNILIVDNDNDIRKSLKQFLEEHLDVAVLEAEDGFCALEILKRAPIHTIISDIQLPKMDGLEFMRQARKMSIKTPVIFQSGFADKDIAIQALRLGVFDFFEKPFKKEVLLESVTAALAYKSATVAFKLAKLDLKFGQIKILEMLMNGKSNKEIANIVNLSEQGVKYHVGALLERFCVKNRVDLKNKVFVPVHFRKVIHDSNL